MPAIVRTIVGVQNRRHVVRLDDDAHVEAVVYRHDTLCISTQVGCAVGCPFCASGANGFTRNLTPDELQAQVQLSLDAGDALRRVTLSGIGEPLHSPHTLDFMARCRREGLLPSATTSGGPVSRLPELLSSHHNGITISVHAGSEPVRARLVPRGPSLEKLFGTLGQCLPQISNNRRKKIALAYLVVAGQNDSDAELDAFLQLAKPLNQTVHLFAYNEVPTSDMAPVSRARYEAIYERACQSGLRIRMSSTARIEANGGCGTLVALRRADSAAAPRLSPAPAMPPAKPA